jgi:hypothetical protein
MYYLLRLAIISRIYTIRQANLATGSFAFNGKGMGSLNMEPDIHFLVA